MCDPLGCMREKYEWPAWSFAPRIWLWLLKIFLHVALAPSHPWPASTRSLLLVTLPCTSLRFTMREKKEGKKKNFPPPAAPRRASRAYPGATGPQRRAQRPPSQPDRCFSGEAREPMALYSRRRLPWLGLPTDQAVTEISLAKSTSFPLPFGSRDAPSWLDQAHITIRRRLRCPAGSTD